jgi:hypothetical protein
VTSIKQIEANRRNAGNSTGPRTAAGKARSRCNAVRHGLTAETVIGALEDAEDYKAFEAAIIADYDAQTTVERELVLRLASLLWRLRRATAIETQLFEIQAENLRTHNERRQAQSKSGTIIYGLLTAPVPAPGNDQDRQTPTAPYETASEFARTPQYPAPDLARCFLRLVNLPTFPLDRLSRYEAILWRQAGQILFALMPCVVATQAAVPFPLPGETGRKRETASSPLLGFSVVPPALGKLASGLIHHVSQK